MAAPEKQDDSESVLRFNAELVEAVEQLQKVNQQLREELDLYRRRLFGQSSERHIEDDSQLQRDAERESRRLATQQRRTRGGEAKVA